MSKKRTIRFDKETDEKLEQLIAESGKTVSELIRDVVHIGKVEKVVRVGDKAIQEALRRFHNDMNENYLHTNAKLEQVEDLIGRLGAKAGTNERLSDLFQQVDLHLLQVKQALLQYRRQGDQEVSEIVNLQR